MKKNIFILMAFTICLSLASQKSALLQYNLEANQVYRAKHTSVQNTTQSVQGMQQSVQATNTMVFSLKPLKKEADHMVAEIRIDTIITVTSMPPMEINSSREGNLQSANPAEMLECIFNRMTKSPYLVKMSYTGHIIEIMNIKQVNQALMQGMDSIQGPVADFVKTQSDMMIGEQAIKSMIETITAYLPGKEIKTGGSWETSLKLSSGGMGISLASTYKLNSLDNNKAVVSANTNFNTSGSGPMEMGGAKITPDISGIGKSDITLDVKTGWVVKSSYKQQLKGDMHVSAPGTSMQIPVEINTTGEIVALP